MEHKRLESLQKWCEKEQLGWKIIGRYEDGQFTPTGILISTDYIGEYPTKSVYDLHDKIKKHAKRNKLRYEACSMHVGARLFANVQ